jgi:predicted RNA binding protein YcfA (HicA-like mRNA interferase family)
VPPRPLPYHEVKRRLESAGFTEVSQRGSHVKFIKQSDLEIRIVIVPRHREVAAGTLRSILRQAGLTWDEFEGPSK